MSRLRTFILGKQHDKKVVRAYLNYIFPDMTKTKLSLPALLFFPVFLAITYPIIFTNGFTILFVWLLVFILFQRGMIIRPMLKSRTPCLILMTYYACSYGLTKVIITVIGVEFLINRNDRQLTVTLAISGAMISLICLVGCVKFINYLVYNAKRINSKFKQNKIASAKSLNWAKFFEKNVWLLSLVIMLFLVRIVMPATDEERFVIMISLVCYAFFSLLAYAFAYVSYLIWKYDCTDLKI